ncbi:unnamed protein product [Miscanthus lutarioriparius]|uniref:Uncharacterized protein n=1 Tax=Miscanthus lutarioriparius TaxID=422564 RepID=A0A811NWC9_9POAL|nr:unnamed protein product [Miscanthus lutarioriparius]
MAKGRALLRWAREGAGVCAGLLRRRRCCPSVPTAAGGGIGKAGGGGAGGGMGAAAEEPAGEAELPGGAGADERRCSGEEQSSWGAGKGNDSRREEKSGRDDEKPMSILTCRFGSMDGWPTGTPVRTIGLLLLGRLLIGLGGMNWDVIERSSPPRPCRAAPLLRDAGSPDWRRPEDESERRRGMT